MANTTIISRVPWFYRATRCLKSLMMMSFVGLARICLIHYAGFDIKDFVFSTVGSMIGAGGKQEL